MKEPSRSKPKSAQARKQRMRNQRRKAMRLRGATPQRREALIALDWIEFDAVDHATLCAHLVTTHGYATPLCWQTVRQSSLDAYLKVNTVKHRTHSLCRQGTLWFERLPTMPDDWFERLMAAFAEVLAEHADLRRIVGAI